MGKMTKRYCSALVLWTLAWSHFLVVLPVAGAESNTVPGWTVNKLTDPKPVVGTCTATWTNGGPAGLSILAEGPLLTLTISSPAFGHEKREEVISLRTRRLAELQRQAVVFNSTYGITIDKDVDAYLLDDGPLTITIKAVDYSFAIANASSAIDAVRQCVGQPTRAEMQAKNVPSFSVPKGWEALDLGVGCTARLEGKEVDTMLSINNDNQVLLIAGRREWNALGEEVKLTLQFDSQPPGSFKGWRWNNLVLLLLVDDKDVAALRKASTLKWRLPTGDYTAEVHDVGSALDAASACTKQKRVSASH